MKGIDVSVHQGAIDWVKVKAAGIVFAILRTGFGWMDQANQKDKRFEEYYSGAAAVGIERGAYHYSYAMTTAQAVLEADFCAAILNKRPLEYPVFFDMEEQDQARLGKKLVTDIALAFINRMTAHGYYCGLYTNLNWVRNYLDMPRLKDVDIWLATYSNLTPDTCDRSKDCDMWQWTSTGKVAGISGGVDRNVSYKDFPTLIRGLGMNHLSITYKSDTTNDDKNPVQIKKGTSYQVKITGEDIPLVAGTPGIVQLLRCRREGNETFWHVVPLDTAKLDEKVGIYPAGDKTRIFVAQIKEGT